MDNDLKPSLILEETENDDFLYLGSGEHAQDLKLLKSLGITHILNVTLQKQYQNYFPEEFKYHRIPISDKKETDITEFFEEAHVFIRIFFIFLKIRKL